MRLSLNYASCTVALLGVVLLLVVAFVLGRASVGGASVGAGQWMPGKHYLLIRAMADRSDASKLAATSIADYCKEHGCDAEVFAGQKQWEVWSTCPFDSPSEASAKQLLARVQELGRNYQALPGKEPNAIRAQFVQAR